MNLHVHVFAANSVGTIVVHEFHKYIFYFPLIFLGKKAQFVCFNKLGINIRTNYNEDNL